MLGGNAQCTCILRKGQCWDTAKRLPEVDHFPPSTGSFLDKFNSRSTSSSSLSLPVVVVVSPLNSLISDQIRRSTCTEGKIKATVFKVRKTMNQVRVGLQRNKSDVTQGRETGEIQPRVYTPQICFVQQKRIETVSKFTLPTIR